MSCRRPPIPPLRKIFGEVIISPTWPEVYDFEREVEITKDEWEELVVYVIENPSLQNIFRLYTSSSSGAHKHVVSEFCDINQALFESCICRIGAHYRIKLVNEQMKTIAGPIVDAYQMNSTIHIPDIVVKNTLKYGKYEVGVIAVVSTETWDHFSGRMQEYCFVSSRSNNPLTWPVFVGGIKMFEHSKFKRPKVNLQTDSRELQQWKDLPLTALAELPEDEDTPEGGEVVDEDADRIAEPAPRGCEYVLTRCIMANGQVWCGELSAWFILFDVSRYLSDDEREVINDGLISGKTLEGWALGLRFGKHSSSGRFSGTYGCPQPMLEIYDSYPQEPYKLFCQRYRRLFARARFEVWKHGFEDWRLYKQEHDEADVFKTEDDVERAFAFSALGAELKRQRDGAGLPLDLQLPFGDIVDAVRHGAMCCARNRLETFKRHLPGEVGFDHTSLGLAHFTASAPSAPTDEAVFLAAEIDADEDAKNATLVRVRQREEERRVNEERRQRL
ncbi:hypothetical protein B0H21DRAFT_840733 [Amylocystis lapponica]|nr:hypothetical protein B0H21DRAFT_840733 [Amylocystis lapponica]